MICYPQQVTVDHNGDCRFLARSSFPGERPATGQPDPAPKLRFKNDHVLVKQRELSRVMGALCTGVIKASIIVARDRSQMSRATDTPRNQSVRNGDKICWTTLPSALSAQLWMKRLHRFESERG